jgi:hypothetical protein
MHILLRHNQTAWYTFNVCILPEGKAGWQRHEMRPAKTTLFTSRLNTIADKGLRRRYTRDRQSA